ncbi:OmpA family protein [Aquabacterium sp.]|uniref:OmpA family protein n=1 Tax=Aquabacterium sp. TaxID=1872578 RepID=UPI0025C4FEB2|nr:OmpA family protein [Aquabacterium sp.]
MKSSLFKWMLGCLGAAWLQGAFAQVPAAAGAAQVTGPNQVVVAGTVPDEATRVAVISRMRELYGVDRVVDQLTLGSVVAPPQWNQYVQKLLSPSLKQVSHGQLSIQGNTVDLRGEVGNESVRQQIASDMAQSLNPTYTVRNGLRVAVQEQAVVDQALANRIVEFEPGSAVLRPTALPILDEMAAAMTRLKGRKFEVIGHTDASGGRAANVSLSLARAQSVKSYLVGKGLPADSMAISGLGPDQPVASNATDEGRARNRRIEFRVGF